MTIYRYFFETEVNCNHASKFHVNCHNRFFVQTTGDDIPQLTSEQVDKALAIFGWREYEADEEAGRKVKHHLCPTHRNGYVCVRCHARDCVCVGGPRFEVFYDPEAEK